MITLTATSDGSAGGQYIARLVGRHKSYTFAREFVGRKVGSRHERTDADIDSSGLYEICDITRGGIRRGDAKDQRYVIVLDVGHRLAEFACEKRTAMQIARSLDDDLSITQIVRASADGASVEILTPAQARREQRAADVARSIQTVADECWAALQSLPTREARRVITDLRRRLSPPTVADEAPASADGEAAQ